jgi:hypothetical protein
MPSKTLCIVELAGIGNQPKRFQVVNLSTGVRTVRLARASAERVLRAAENARLAVEVSP